MMQFRSVMCPIIGIVGVRVFSIIVLIIVEATFSTHNIKYSPPTVQRV